MAAASRRLVRRLHCRKPFDAVLGYCVIPFGDCAVRLGKMLDRPAACVAIGSDLHLVAQASNNHRRLTRRVMRGATRVLTLCKELGATAVELGAKPESVRAYYEGIDVSPFNDLPTQAQARARLELPVNDRLVTFIGRIHRPKGVFELVEAFKATSPAHPEWRLLLIGEPIERDELCGYMAELSIDRRVDVRGIVPRSEVPAYLAASDIYVLPSHAEGLSFGLQEAMAAGCTVIATPVGGHPEVVQDRVNGRLVPPRDAEALAEVLSELMGDQEQAARLGRAARRTVFERFDASRNAGTLAGLIEEMCVS